VTAVREKLSITHVGIRSTSLVREGSTLTGNWTTPEGAKIIQQVVTPTLQN
jgi:hypothetical protein